MELPPPLPHEQQHRTQASQLSHSKAAPASVELELEVCTSPGQVVVGWEGEKQEQQVNAQSGASVVQLLARMEGCHVPVAVMECKPATVEACNPGSEFMKQKQVRSREGRLGRGLQRMLGEGRPMRTHSHLFFLQSHQCNMAHAHGTSWPWAIHECGSQTTQLRCNLGTCFRNMLKGRNVLKTHAQGTCFRNMLKELA
eukprot:scaffold8365_cov22-Tisochrysis_lutea.AAC.3